MHHTPIFLQNSDWPLVFQLTVRMFYNSQEVSSNSVEVSLCFLFLLLLLLLPYRFCVCLDFFLIYYSLDSNIKWKSYALSLFYMLYLSFFFFFNLLSQLLCFFCGSVCEDSKSTEFLIIES